MTSLTNYLLCFLITLMSFEMDAILGQQCADPGTLPTALKYKDSPPTYPIDDATTVEFVCETGYTLVGTNPATCTSGTLTLPTCTGCADPGTLPTKLKYKNTAPSYPIDTTTSVDFECETGYTLVGTNPAVCTGNTFTLPTCTGCADPGTLSTGLKYKGDAPTYPIADKASVEFECDDGYTLGGTNPAVCTGNTFTLPTCTSATSCADPGTLTTGLKYKGDAPTYPIADKVSVEFECDDGYTLGGTNPAVCTEGTLTLPTCTADSGSSSNIASIFAILSLTVAVLAQ